MKKILIMMIGAPGSGKSTYVSNNLKDGQIWISRDAIRYSMVKENEDYFSKENEVINTFIQSINKCLSPKSSYTHIIADATHLSPKSRGVVLNQITEHYDELIGVYFDIPLEVVQKRNAQRQGRERVPAAIVANMYRSMRIPTRDEGFTSVFIIDENNKTKSIVRYKEEEK